MLFMNQLSANQFADELHQRTIERRRSDRNRKFWGITAIIAGGAAALGSVILVANSREHDATKLDIRCYFTGAATFFADSRTVVRTLTGLFALTARASFKTK